MGATLLTIIALGACDGSGSEREDPRASSSGAAGLGADGRPAAVADSPLTARHGMSAVWTGREVVVVGGDTHAPCPPGADCMITPQPSKEVAAYDPSSDTWRDLPEAPVPVADAHAAWSGTEMVVVRGPHTLALDPAAGAWRRLERAPVVGDFVVRTDRGLVFVAYQQHPGRRPVDWLLDPESGRWSPLPRDPFGESYDRSMAWDGTRLWLLSMAVENHFEAYRGAPSRLAVLERGRWRVVDPATPPLRYEQDLRWFQHRLVVAGGPRIGQSRTYDPGTERWAVLSPRAPLDSCPDLPAAGPGPHWLSGGGSALISRDPEDVRSVPCDEVHGQEVVAPDVAVWAGDALLVLGGDFDDDATRGFWWTPPMPH